MKPPFSPSNRFLDEAKALACVHCGLCLGACPTYLETGNENDSPRGRIYIMRALQDGRLPMADAAVRHIDLCLGCRACEVACPSGVQYGDLLEATREQIEKRYSRSAFQTFLRRTAIERVFPYPLRMKLALFPAQWLKRFGMDRFLPKFAREALSLIPVNAKSIPLPELSPATSAQKQGRVGFIRGCVMSVLFGDTNASSVRLLNQAGYDVLTPKAQGCCGALYAHGGNLQRARECARHNIEVFEKLGFDAIIINAAGCGSTLKEYGHLLHDDSAWAERGRQFSSKVKDLTEWLSQPGGEPSNLRSQISDLVTYHDACHLAHPQRITQPPRELIRRVAGRQFVELPESDVCCGSAGTYNLTEPEMAERLQQRKIENILKTGARTVVTTNPGCILQIRAGLDKAGATGIQVLHIADFLVATAEGK
ncbi:MAG: (Fe-S)-binding protein [Pedosphaera sp.]|nr:(Fe-S)-binding protein [Pedosphaera sp.]